MDWDWKKISWKQDVKEFVYFNGFKVGLILIMLPIIGDLIYFGGREFSLVSIGTKGVLCQIVGLVLMWMGGRDSK